MNKDKIKFAKEKYNNIYASDELKNRIKNTFNKKSNWKKYATYVASIFTVVLVFSGALNINESFAKSISNINGMKEIVNVLTLNKYNFEKNNLSAEINIPKIQGLFDKDLEDKVNEKLKRDAENMISEFQNIAGNIEEQNSDEYYYAKSDYIIKTNDEKILSFEVYFYTAIGSSNTYKKFYNIDKINKKDITLESILNTTEKFEIVSKYIKEEMQRRNSDETESQYNMYWIGEEMDGFTEIDKNQNFYINQNGNLVIAFDKYEVGPGVLGCPEFEIPKDIITIR